MKRTVTIEVSLPHKSLSPNTQTHWGTRAKAKAKARETARLAAHDACGGMPPRWPFATVEAKFILPNRRGLKADQDNRIGSLKATMDGVADAGVILNDRGLTWLPIKHDIDPARPRVVLTFTESKER